MFIFFNLLNSLKRAKNSKNKNKKGQTMSLYKNHGVIDDGIKRSHPFSLVAEDFDLCTL